MKKESGQAMIEFAVTLMAMILLLFGIIDFGYLYESKLQAEYAVAEGARAGMVVENKIDRIKVVRETVEKSAPLLSDPLRRTVLVTEVNGEMTVYLKYQAKVLTPVGGVLFPTGIKTIESTCVIHVN